MNWILAPQYLINGLLAGIIYATYTIGYSLVLTTSRFMHVCHGGIVAVSGLNTWYLATKCGVPLLFAALLGILSGIIVGVFLEVVVYRRLRKRGLPFLLTMIVSLGCMTVIENVLAMLFSTTTKYFGNNISIPSIFIGRYAIPGWQSIGFVISLVLLVGLVLLLKYTKIGAEIQSVASNMEMAKLIGLNLDKVHLITMILASFLASWVGVIEVITHGISNTAGSTFMLVGIVIRALGGARNTRNLVIAGVLYGLVENMALMFVPSKWSTVLTFGIFIAAVLIRANPSRNALEKLGGGL